MNYIRKLLKKKLKKDSWSLFDMDENYKVRMKNQGSIGRLREDIASVVTGGVVGLGMGALGRAVGMNLDRETILVYAGFVSGAYYFTLDRKDVKKNYFLESLITGTSFAIGLTFNRLVF